MVKNPSAMQETWVQSLGWEDTLEESMATHSATVHRVTKSPTLCWTTERLSLTYVFESLCYNLSVSLQYFEQDSFEKTLVIKEESDYNVQVHS